MDPCGLCTGAGPGKDTAKKSAEAAVQPAFSAVLEPVFNGCEYRLLTYVPNSSRTAQAAATNPVRSAMRAAGMA